MDGSQPDALLQQVLACSREIRDLAAAGDWIAGEIREVHRQALIKRCFAPGAIFRDTAAAASTVREILELDHQTIALGLSAREGLRAAAHQLRQGRAALLAYQQAQG